MVCQIFQKKYALNNLQLKDGEGSHLKNESLYLHRTLLKCYENLKNLTKYGL